MLPSGLIHVLTRSIRRLGINGVRLHDLRHTHASLLLEQGVHPKVVQERLGHASIGITLDNYSYLSASIQQAAVETFDKVLDDTLPVNGRLTQVEA